MSAIIIAGAGAHAGSVIELLKYEQDRFDVVGIVDPLASGEAHGVPILGDDSILPELKKEGVQYAFPGVGFGQRTDNTLRKKIFLTLKEAGFEIPSLASSHAVIRRNVQIGEGVLIQAGCVIDSCSTLNANVLLGLNVLVGHHCILGAHSTLAGGVILNGGVGIGEGVFMGMGSIAYRDVGDWAKLAPGVACLTPIPAHSLVFGSEARIIHNLRQKEGQI
jgi:UDP-perosamine 4-acetyltransferase